MAKAKSESPSRNAKMSRARQSVRTSSARLSPPCSAGTTALRKPPSPSAFTRARQAASRSSCGSAASVASAQRARLSAKRRWPSSKNGQLSVSSRPISIALEDRLLLGGEGAERARKVLRLHAQRLGDRLGLDRALDRHRPFHVEHALGHGIGESRPGGQFGGELLRLGAHGVPSRISLAIAKIAPAPAHTPSTAAMIGCGQARMALTTSPVMRVKSRSCTAPISISGLMISNTSPPEQKLPPAPVTTNALTAFSLAAARKRSTISA